MSSIKKNQYYKKVTIVYFSRLAKINLFHPGWWAGLPVRAMVQSFCVSQKDCCAHKRAGAGIKNMPARRMTYPPVGYLGGYGYSQGRIIFSGVCSLIYFFSFSSVQL